MTVNIIGFIINKDDGFPRIKPVSISEDLTYMAHFESGSANYIRSISINRYRYFKVTEHNLNLYKEYRNIIYFLENDIEYNIKDLVPDFDMKMKPNEVEKFQKEGYSIALQHNNDIYFIKEKDIKNNRKLWYFIENQNGDRESINISKTKFMITKNEEYPKKTIEMSSRDFNALNEYKEFIEIKLKELSNNFENEVEHPNDLEENFSRKINFTKNIPTVSENNKEDMIRQIIINTIYQDVATNNCGMLSNNYYPEKVLNHSDIPMSPKVFNISQNSTYMFQRFLGEDSKILSDFSSWKIPLNNISRYESIESFINKVSKNELLFESFSKKMGIKINKTSQFRKKIITAIIDNLELLNKTLKEFIKESVIHNTGLSFEETLKEASLTTLLKTLAVSSSELGFQSYQNEKFKNFNNIYFDPMMSVFSEYSGKSHIQVQNVLKKISPRFNFDGDEDTDFSKIPFLFGFNNSLIKETYLKINELIPLFNEFEISKDDFENRYADKIKGFDFENYFKEMRSIEHQVPFEFYKKDFEVFNISDYQIKVDNKEKNNYEFGDEMSLKFYQWHIIAESIKLRRKHKYSVDVDAIFFKTERMEKHREAYSNTTSPERFLELALENDPYINFTLSGNESLPSNVINILLENNSFESVVGLRILRLPNISESKVLEIINNDNISNKALSEVAHWTKYKSVLDKLIFNEIITDGIVDNIVGKNINIFSVEEMKKMLTIYDFPLESIFQRASQRFSEEDIVEMHDIIKNNLERVFKNEDKKNRFELIQDYIPEDLIKILPFEILKPYIENRYNLEEILKNENVPSNVLKKYCGIKEEIDETILQHPSCNGEVLMKLSNSKSFWIKRAILKEDSVPNDVIIKMTKDYDEKIQALAFKTGVEKEIIVFK